MHSAARESKIESKIESKAEQIEEKELTEERTFQRILHDFYAIQAIPITVGAELFLCDDKPVTDDFNIKISSLSDSNRLILRKWIQKKHPIYLKRLDDLLPREITLSAYLYMHGVIFERDYRQSFLLFQRAAELGDLHAQTMLGICYRKGLGIQKDIPMAHHYLTQADERGHPKAANSLGMLFDLELNDEARAVHYYQKAVKQESSDGLGNLGLCYLRGYGVPQNACKAFELTLKSVARGNPQSLFGLGILYETGTGTSKSLSRSAICYRIAMQYLPTDDVCYSKAKQQLLKIFDENPTEPHLNYQALLAFQQDAKIRVDVQSRYEKAIPYATETVKKLFSLPLASLEKIDAFSHHDVECIAITWSVLTMCIRFSASQYTDVILGYLLPLQEIVNQIKQSEEKQREAREHVTLISSLKNLIYENPLQQAREFKINYQRAWFFKAHPEFMKEAEKHSFSMR